MQKSFGENFDRKEVTEITQVAAPKILPYVVMQDSLFDRDDYMQLPEKEKIKGVVASFEVRGFGGSHAMHLLRDSIDDMHYIFRVYEGMQISFSFFTEEYGFAFTRLSDAGRQKLVEDVTSFLETLYVKSEGRLSRFSIDPADTSYEKQDIIDCREKISLSFPEYTQEVLLRDDYEGVKLFELYNELFGTYYHEKHPNSTIKNKERGKLFRMYVIRHLKNWNIEKFEGLGERFTLVRNEKNSEERFLVEQK